MIKNRLKPTGFTLAELLIATIIMSILILTGASVYTNFFNTTRNIRSANVVYEEARFTMERMVSEIRNGTIDYEEYFNQANNFFGAGLNRTYGENYCEYSREFYEPGPDGQFGTFDDEITGKRSEDSNPPIENRIQEKLYLIDTSGTRRTYVQRIETDDGFGNTIGKVAMLKLRGEDWGIDHLPANATTGCTKDNGENDDLVDTWVCDTGFKCFTQTLNCGGSPVDQDTLVQDDPDDLSNSSFVDITPDSLDIVDLKFFITPTDDPRKAYTNPDVQIQPHVTIKMIARANPRIAAGFRGETPSIVLESTISARTQSEIITECNLQECIDNTVKECPKVDGVCRGTALPTEPSDATQTCGGSVWPGCSNQNYIDVAGVDDTAPLVGVTLFEPLTENGVCTDDACKTRRCGDGHDNDCDGLTDANDPDCLFFLCNNGVLDPGEICTDVGGPCQNFRPYQEAGELSCFDGYDNDCSYVDYTGIDFADLSAEDQAIILADPVYNDPNYPDGEKYKWSIALGQGADEYDTNCIDQICNDGKLSDRKRQEPSFLSFGDYDFSTPNLLLSKDYAFIGGEMDEVCIEIGGLCERASTDHRFVADEGTEDNGGAQTPGYLCYDGLDNDCDFVLSGGAAGSGADELDDKCHPAICSNGVQECDLIDDSLVGTEDYEFDYLVNYKDSACVQNSNRDEQCVDGLGICDSFGTGGIENTKELCTDDADNDCNLATDGDRGPNSDKGCCPDADGDNRFDTSLHLEGHPDDYCPDADKIAAAAGPYGVIDCNDEENTIPTTNVIDIEGVSYLEEVCNNFRFSDAPYSYDNTHPLFDQPVDNNCSAINEIYPAEADSGWDYQDPACCIDLDGDGFGIEDAYLYKGNPAACYNNTGGQFGYDGNFDCDDSDPNIHPPTSDPPFDEDTVELCTDGINNNCKMNALVFPPGEEYKNNRIDHIDMYELEAGGIAQAHADERFDPACCNLAAIEICLDGNSLRPGGTNSDENCNGLEGSDDHFCIYSTDRRFHNTFTKLVSGDGYIANLTDLTYDAAEGQIIKLANNPLTGTALSQTTPFLVPANCDTGAGHNLSQATINHSHEALPAGAEIEYELSNDGGTTWCGDDDCAGDTITSGEILSNENTVNFPNDPVASPENQLVWRVTMGAPTLETIKLNSVVLDYTCN